MLVFHFLPHEHVCPLLPDEANKNKTISVIAKRERERERYTGWFRRSFFKKIENFTKNVSFINVFATQTFRSFRWLTFPSLLLAKS